MKAMIVSNRFKPGQRLTDRHLADLLQVSRTPVRVALQRLEQDALVSHQDGHGYVVSEMDVKRIGDLYELREYLEGGAARLAARRANQLQITRLEAVAAREQQLSHRRGERAQWVKLGLQWHELIAHSSGNQILAETIVRVLDQMRVFVWLEVLAEDDEMAHENCREHSALIEFIKNRRPDEAEALMRSHIRRAKEHILKAAAVREAFYADVGMVLPLEATAHFVSLNSSDHQ